jgi:hypothetical protein
LPGCRFFPISSWLLRRYLHQCFLLLSFLIYLFSPSIRQSCH